MTTAYFIGDSFLYGIPPGYAVAMSARLGWTPTVDGLGGTGWLAPGSFGAAGPYLARLPACIAANPDVVMVPGGSNDASFTVPQVQAALATFFAALRVGLPTVTLYVSSAWWTPQLYHDAIVAACAAAGGTFLDTGGTYGNARTGPVWLTGTGNAGAPAGDGNRDVYMAGTAPHLTAAGYAYLGTRLAFAIRPPNTGLA